MIILAVFAACAIFASNMIHIDQHIAELLMRHDSLVIPDFGGFVSRRIPASWSSNGERMLPPYRQLLFHSHLNLSDGVLEQYIAFREKMSFAEAQVLVRTAVTSWQQRLRLGERIELEKIGYFYADASQKVRFDQDRTFNLLLQSYGLGELVFEKQQHIVESNTEHSVEERLSETIEFAFDEQPVESANASQDDDKVVPFAQKIEDNQSTFAPRWTKWAAAAVLLPLTFYSFWVPLTTDVLETKVLAFSDFNPFHQVKKAKYLGLVLNQPEEFVNNSLNLDQIVNSLPEDALYYNFNYDEELILPVRIERKSNSVTDNMPTVTETKSSVPTVSTAQKIHLISGCFSQKENADNHVQSLKSLGFDAYIVDVKGGLHRVAALGVRNEDELASASMRLKEKDIAFWTLKQ